MSIGKSLQIDVTNDCDRLIIKKLPPSEAPLELLSHKKYLHTTAQSGKSNRSKRDAGLYPNAEMSSRKLACTVIPALTQGIRPGNWQARACKIYCSALASSRRCGSQ
jgi:hypothetical protein